MKYLVKNVALLVICTLIYFKGNTQDLHYSQFYNSPLNVNPALTGVFNGDHRYLASFRDQGRFVPVPWTTFSAAYDRKIYLENEKNIIGVGGNFNYDRQGTSRLNLSSLNLLASWSRILNKNNVVTGGVLLGFASRGFNLKDLTWDKQWDGVSFDPNAPSEENFDVKRLYFLETGLGVNYRLQKDARTKIDMGVGAYHLYEPTANFYDNDGKRLPMHLTFNALGSVKIIDALDLQLHFLHQLQDKYQETVFGGLAKFYISKKRGAETELHAGLGYRTSKSFIPTLAVQYTNIYLGVSYDFDNTELNEVLNSNRGGFEIHARYIITTVKPLKDRKVCPIY